MAISVRSYFNCYSSYDFQQYGWHHKFVLDFDSEVVLLIQRILQDHIRPSCVLYLLLAAVHNTAEDLVCNPNVHPIN